MRNIHAYEDMCIGCSGPRQLEDKIVIDLHTQLAQMQPHLSLVHFSKIISLHKTIRSRALLLSGKSNLLSIFTALTVKKGATNAEAIFVLPACLLKSHKE